MSLKYPSYSINELSVGLASVYYRALPIWSLLLSYLNVKLIIELSQYEAYYWALPIWSLLLSSPNMKLIIELSQYEAYYWTLSIWSLLLNSPNMKLQFLAGLGEVCTPHLLISIISKLFSHAPCWSQVLSSELAVKQPSQLAVKQSSQLAVKQFPRHAVKQPSQPAVKQPSQLTVKQPSQLAVKQPSQLAVKQPSQLAVKQPSQFAVKHPSQYVVYQLSQHFTIFYVIKHIMIIIKRGRQCKAGREWFTPYQSKDSSPTIPTYRKKEEKGKTLSILQFIPISVLNYFKCLICLTTWHWNKWQLLSISDIL